MYRAGTNVSDARKALKIKGFRASGMVLVDEEFSCLEFYMNRDTISWILKKVGCLSEITAYLF